ncbi:MAG: hypothetical protein JW915_02060 [Chitinispirillaceae bacterium]|nr:hypothetical protein [Chitinispirillaceae bacterium]
MGEDGGVVRGASGRQGGEGERRQEKGDRRQEKGDRRQEKGERRQETGDRRQGDKETRRRPDCLREKMGRCEGGKMRMRAITPSHAFGMNASLTGDAPSVVEVRGHGVITPGEVSIKAKNANIVL